MKKVYEKPEILFESLASSTNIAGDCLKIIDTFSYGLCGFVYDDEHTRQETGQHAGCGGNPMYS